MNLVKLRGVGANNIAQLSKVLLPCDNISFSPSSSTSTTSTQITASSI